MLWAHSSVWLLLMWVSGANILNHRNIFMEIDVKLAELIGLFIGDGCLSRWECRGRQISAVIFTGSLENDMQYYNDIVCSIIDEKFKLRSNIRIRRNYNAIELKYYNRNFVDFLRCLGFSFGKKIEIEIPTIILENHDNLKACIRGIFNSDGTVYRRYSKQHDNHKRLYDKYAVVEIKINSKKLLEQIKEELNRLDFNVNKIVYNKGYPAIRITQQDDVDRFFREISTTHPYHIKRYNNIRNI